MTTKSRNVRGKSGDKARGSWCTAKPVAIALGAFDVDPFSNPRSHIIAETACMLERGDDGLAGPRRGEYFVGPQHGSDAILVPGETPRMPSSSGRRRATEDTRVWLQPDYSMVQLAIDHYEHTRFVALLRFDQRTDWFKRIYARSEAVRVLWDAEFEPPPGVSGGQQSFPHALYFKHAEDVTDEVRRISFGWTKKRKD